MERVVIKHITGSKANQVETFPLDKHREFTVGRDPLLDIKFDPERDDLVSRKHAKIEQDLNQKEKFLITDLESRNGVFVNKVKVVNRAELHHGDVIQLGVNGPEFTFELDPPPANALRATRLAEYQPELLNPTREAQIEVPPPVLSTQESQRSVGRATVERLISQNKSEARKYLLNGAAIVLGVVILIAGFFVYKNVAVERQLAANREETARRLAETQAAVKQTGSEVEKIRALMSPKEIAGNYAPATVYIEVSWKLVDTVSGRQVYHRYMDFKDKKVVASMPTYIQLPDGTIEPWLVTDDGAGKNRPIGGIHTGSGFVVTENGFILTNRHVAASWYTQGSTPLPGILFTLMANGELVNPRLIESHVGKLEQWVPAKGTLLGGKNVGPKRVEGRHDTLDVTFPKNKLRIPAKLVRISNEHDVALIKIDTPQAVKKVELNDNYDAIRSGDTITILGYPGISPKVYVQTKSQDLFNPVPDVVDVPDPTVTPGVIGKVIRGRATPEGGEKSDYYSESDSYQLTANATGMGNSGGPVFDEYGKVIGIFYAGTGPKADARITFAVPIKFGIDLMRVSPVL